MEALEFAHRVSTETGADWATITEQALQRVATSPVPWPDGAHRAVAGICDALGDPHGRFFDPERESEIRTGVRHRALGIVLAPSGFTIIRVSPGSPAAHSALSVGDRVTHIDGVEVSEACLIGLGEASPIGGVRGQVPSVVVSALGSDGQRKSVRIEFAEVGSQADPIGHRLSGDIGYLELPAVAAGSSGASYAQAAHDLMRAIDLRPVTGWIVDVRRNTGGNPWPMLAAIGGILGPGVLGGMATSQGSAAWVYHDGSILVGDAPMLVLDDPFAGEPGLPIAVLTSDVTASAAEARVLACRGRANCRMFGARSAGLTTTTVSMCMRDSALMIVADGWMCDRFGIAYPDGVHPDELLVTDWSRFAGSEDRVVRAARDWIEGRAASGLRRSIQR